MLEDETNFDSKLPWVLFGILFEYVLVLEHPHIIQVQSPCGFAVVRTLHTTFYSTPFGP